MPYTFTLTATIPATPVEIFEAWLGSIGHSEMTGGEATMSDEVGAEVTAWDGYISGRNLELVPGERIVQSWRTTEFADGDQDSIITVVLQEVDEGTLLTLMCPTRTGAMRRAAGSRTISSRWSPISAKSREISPSRRHTRRRQRRRRKRRPNRPPEAAARKPPAKRLPPKKAPVERGEPRARAAQNGQRRPRKLRRRRSKGKARRRRPPQQRARAPSRPRVKPLAARGDKS
jgi:uncharacterized protein YndB with AHSA1/START domain